MKRTIHKTTTVLTTTEIRISAAEIIEKFGLPAGTILTVHVPGGGDWSNEDLELDDRNQVIVATSKTTEQEEDVSESEQPSGIDIECPRCGADPGVYCDADGAPESAFLIHVERTP